MCASARDVEEDQAGYAKYNWHAEDFKGCSGQIRFTKTKFWGGEKGIGSKVFEDGETIVRLGGIHIWRPHWGGEAHRNF